MSKLPNKNTAGLIAKELLQDFEGHAGTYPHIILGQFERVGSTFFLDNYEATRLVHNEPYKQLVPESWPIARGYHGKLCSNSDEFFHDDRIQPLNKLWMYNFVLSRYVPDLQIIKETNLYFALPIFLSFFPYRSIEVLSRHPLGIIGSFERNDLFHMWNYHAVVEALRSQLLTMEQTKQNRYEVFFTKTTDWKVCILRLIALNSMIIAESLSVESPKITRYDEVIKLARPDAPLERDESSIFGTSFRKEYDDFDRRFTDETIEALLIEATQCIEFAHTQLREQERNLFDKLFTTYFEQSFVRKSQAITVQLDTMKAKIKLGTYPVNSCKLTAPKFVQLLNDQPLEWAISLVTNEEMGAFMQELLDNGLDPSLMHLFIREHMIPERGGRLQLQDDGSRVYMTKGYERHPVYWISWLGAAAYALRVGAVLPTSTAWQKVYDSYTWPASGVANHTYAHDDTVETGRITDNNVPFDFFGNVKIWCNDWADAIFQNKVVAGISWKHNLSESYKTISEKPYLTNSRVIGTRLVRCSMCSPRQPLSAQEIILRLKTISEGMALVSPTAIDITEANKEINKLFDCSSTCEHCK